MRAFIYLMCCYCTVCLWLIYHSPFPQRSIIQPRWIDVHALCLGCRMWVTLLYSCAGGAALLYALYRWVIPAAVQYHGGLALFWHDVIVERMLDTLTQSTRPQVCLEYIVLNSHKRSTNTLMTRSVWYRLTRWGWQKTGLSLKKEKKGKIRSGHV